MLLPIRLQTIPVLLKDSTKKTPVLNHNQAGTLPCPSRSCSSAPQALPALVGRVLALDIGDESARASLILLVEVPAAFDEFPTDGVATGVPDLDHGTVLRTVEVEG